MVDWAQAFSGFWGKRIDSLHWMPIPADTPAVVEHLHKPALTFSGCVLLVFGNGETRGYTWSQAADRCLEIGDGDWELNRRLDRIAASPEEPWAALNGACFEAVELFADREDGRYREAKRVVGARHLIEGANGSTVLWIAASFGETIKGDGDDLWVSVGVEPRNIHELVLVRTITPPSTFPRRLLGGA